MNKIPVGATIAQAYSFTFIGFFNLLRVAWLPLVLVIVSEYFAIANMIALLTNTTNQVVAAPASWLMVTASYVAMLILAMVLICGIAQSALGQIPSRPFYFSLGKPVWRLLGAFMLAMLIYIGLIIAATLIATILSFVIGGGGVESLAISGLMFVAYGGVLYSLVRYVFLLTPVVLAENKIGLVRSWRLGSGNFCRMFAILVIVLLPIVLLEILGMRFVIGSFPPFQPGTTPAEFQAEILTWEMGLFRQMNANWYIVYPVFAVIILLLNSLLISAQVFAYRAITRPEGPWDSAPVSGD